MEVSYNQSQLEAAAYYLTTFNSEIYTSFEDAQAAIVAMIKQYASDPEIFYVNTGGVQVCFVREDNFVDIYVDPALMYRQDSNEITVLEINGS